MTTLTDAQIRTQWQRINDVAALLAQRSGSERGFVVAPGSQLAKDDAESHPYRVSTAITLSLTSAIDHLHGLCALALHSGFLHSCSPASLVRGALEGASAAIWIACAAGVDERITRSLQWHMADIKDSDRAAKAAGVESPTPLQVREDKVETVATKRSLNFKMIRGGYKSSDAVKAADAYLQSPIGILTPWQMASGFAHARGWSRLADRSLLTTTSTDDAGVSNVKMEPDHGQLLYLAMPAEEATSTAVRLFDRLAKVP
jgi:hypothetical protein